MVCEVMSLLNNVASLPLGLIIDVERSKVKLESRLGSGAFGVVFKTRDLRANGSINALKDVVCCDPLAIGKAISEVETLRQVKHDSIVKIIAADQYEDTSGGFHVLILTEFCAGGNLNERLSRPSDERKNLKWMSQMASALSYLHSQHIVHRDLKPDNVLIVDSTSEDLKLADFGLAREFLTLKNAGHAPTGLAEYYMRSGTGPAHWIAPEVFTCRFTEKADIFSLGALFNAILERDYAFSSNEQKWYGAFVKVSGDSKVGLGYAMSVIGQAAMEEFKHNLSLNECDGYCFRRLVLDALDYVPKKRPSAEEVYYRLEEASSFLRLQWSGEGGDVRASRARSGKIRATTRNKCCIT